MSLIGKFPLFSLFLFLMIHHVSSLQFNLSSIGPEEANRFINVTGDSYISKQGIQVTPDERKVSLRQKTGRATYNLPLHLWDKASGYLANFQTQFSFVIYADDESCRGDGLAFFLAPVGSSILETSAGSGLGLAHADTGEGDPHSPFVAVEFDTYPNYFDPIQGQHVGIDVNSVKSVAYESWNDNLAAGNVNDAWISYDSSTMNFTVKFTGYRESKSESKSLSFHLDLRFYLPERVIVGFSASTGSCIEKHNVKSWQFNSSNQENLAPAPHLQDNPFPTAEPNNSGVVNANPQGGKKLEIGQVIALMVTLLALVVLAAFLGYILRKKRKRKRNEVEMEGAKSLDSEFQKGLGPRKFAYRELAEATNNFAEQEKLGEGGFGGVYRGCLRDLNLYIAVKRVSDRSNQGPKEYAAEVKTIGQLRHRNLVQLIGWCHEKGQLLLVYEFMANGSLHYHLFRERSLLTWDVRYKIVQGLASALFYLHEEWEQCVVHRDIKSSNIMLDLSFNAKLGDFGLARVVDHEKGSETMTAVAGTMGYMDPECAITGKASKESDVYSFGIVALEVASGRKPIDINNARANANEKIMLIDWIWDLHGKGELLQGADPKLGRKFNHEEMERLMIVGLWCTHPSNSTYTRPTIRQAIRVLNFEEELPVLVLPSEM